MSRWTCILPLLWIALTTAPALRGAEPDAAPLDKLVAESMKAFEVPGAAVVVVQDDKVVYLKGFGVRDKGNPASVTPDTVFAIASCSKAFTSHASLRPR